MKKRSKAEQLKHAQLKLALTVDKELEKLIKQYSKVIWWLTFNFPHEIWKPIFKINIQSGRVTQFPGTKYKIIVRGRPIGSFTIPDREILK